MGHDDAQDGTRPNEFARNSWAATVAMKVKVRVYQAGRRGKTVARVIDHWEEVDPNARKKPPEWARKTIGRWLNGKGIPQSEKDSVLF